jgi:hypothetical protein
VIPYDQFTTGFTFQDIKQMRWTTSEDPRDWRYRRRKGVLGLWHQIKQILYDRYLDGLPRKLREEAIRINAGRTGLARKHGPYRKRATPRARRRKEDPG